MGRIVVGVDGSPPSVDALRWALAEADARHASVEAVSTWSNPVMADAYGGAAMMGFDAAELVKATTQTLEAAIEAACLDPEKRAEIERVVTEGGAGHVLIERSRGAELLVVGSRGHGGFAGLLLGSVSSQCVHHAHCPVTVIRPDGSD